MAETEETSTAAKGMAGFCAFGGSMVGISSVIGAFIYVERQPQAAATCMIAAALAFGLMSNAIFRK